MIQELTQPGFANKKLASPPTSRNARGISLLRKYLQDNGYKTKENGGNVEVIPAENADILVLFLKKQIDSVVGTEPWAKTN